MGKEVLSYNKLVYKTRNLIFRHNVPKHWSKTKNEKFNVHTICILFVLYQIEQKDYRLFSGWLAVTTALGLPSVPHWTTVQKAFKRIPPSLLRSLVHISGRCKDKIAALDPTHYQLTNPSKGYCRRIQRNPARDILRKVSVITTTNKKKVLDVVMTAKEHHGMKHVPKFNRIIFKQRTLLADKEFDAELFHQYIEDCNGKSIVPPRRLDVPIWRTKGIHRKSFKRNGIPKVFTKRAIAESTNSAVKRRFSAVLKGKSYLQQLRDLYGNI